MHGLNFSRPEYLVPIANNVLGKKKTWTAIINFVGMGGGRKPWIILFMKSPCIKIFE